MQHIFQTVSTKETIKYSDIQFDFWLTISTNRTFFQLAQIVH